MGLKCTVHQRSGYREGHRVECCGEQHGAHDEENRVNPFPVPRSEMRYAILIKAFRDQAAGPREPRCRTRRGASATWSRPACESLRAKFSTCSTNACCSVFENHILKSRQIPPTMLVKARTVTMRVSQLLKRLRFALALVPPPQPRAAIGAVAAGDEVDEERIFAHWHPGADVDVLASRRQRPDARSV